MTPTPHIPGAEIADARLREIIDGCKGVTPGPWELEASNNYEDGHGRYEGYEVVAPNQGDTFNVVTDCSNATVAVIHDEDGHRWDKQGETNMAHFARLDPVTVKAMATELLAARESLAARIVPEGWRCFHCDEVFTDEHRARLHFGTDERTVPACQIKGSELGLVEALRRAENDAAEAWHAIHNENTDASKAYYRMVSRHQEQLRAVEEAGYARGLADGRTLGNYLDHMPDRETLKQKIDSDPDIGGGI